MWWVGWTFCHILWTPRHWVNGEREARAGEAQVGQAWPLQPGPPRLPPAWVCLAFRQDSFSWDPSPAASSLHLYSCLTATKLGKASLTLRLAGGPVTMSVQRRPNHGHGSSSTSRPGPGPRFFLDISSESSEAPRLTWSGADAMTLCFFPLTPKLAPLVSLSWPVVTLKKPSSTQV